MSLSGHQLAPCMHPNDEEKHSMFIAIHLTTYPANSARSQIIADSGSSTLFCFTMAHQLANLAPLGQPLPVGPPIYR